MNEHVLKSLNETDRQALSAASAEPGVTLVTEVLKALRESTRDVPDILVGALLEAESPVAMGSTSLADVMARIDAEPDLEPRPVSVQAASTVLDEMIRLPVPLRDLALNAAGSSGWKFAAPGIRTLPLDIDGDMEARLIRIQPGYGVPQHTHAGREYTLCLEGGFSDENGSYGPGDLSIADASVTHTPIADADGPCLVLALNDDALKFTGVIGVLQRVFG